MLKTHVFEYDLNLNMQPADGTLSFDETGRLVSRIGDETLAELSADDISEAEVIAGVGCGLLYAKLNDKNDCLLCRFSMSAMKPAGEFCKIVNYYSQTKQYAVPDEKEKPLCEKCGRPLAEGMTVCLFCYNKMSVLKRALQLMRPFSKKILIAELFLTLSSIIYLLVPLISRFLIDDYLRPMKGTFAQIALLAGAMLLARTLGEIIFILSSRVFNKSSIKYANYLRNAAFEKIQKLSMNALSKRTSGDLIKRVMEDTTTIKEFMSDGGRWAVEQMIMFVIVLVILLFTNVKLTLLVFLPVPVVMFGLSRFWKVINMRYERQWRKISRKPCRMRSSSFPGCLPMNCWQRAMSG